MKTILLIALSGSCFAEPLSQIKEMLDSKQNNERKEAVSELIEIIGNAKNSNDERLDAIQLAASEDLHECAEIIIENIDNKWIRNKSGLSFETSFPCVGALIKIGEESIPGIVKAIMREDQELRLRLLGYSLLRIMKREPALAHLDKLLMEENISADVRKRLQISKEEVGKWSDYPWDTPEIKK